MSARMSISWGALVKMNRWTESSKSMWRVCSKARIWIAWFSAFWKIASLLAITRAEIARAP
jgi:hypothetical protein